MPRLHGWQQDGEDPTVWTYGGSYYAAWMYVPLAPNPNVPQAVGGPTEVRLWPRLGGVGSNDPTEPLGGGHCALTFDSEALARQYVESWERATGKEDAHA